MRPSRIRTTESAVAGWLLVGWGLARDDHMNEAALCPQFGSLKHSFVSGSTPTGDHSARRAGRPDLVDEEGKGLRCCGCGVKVLRPPNQVLRLTRSAPRAGGPPGLKTVVRI
jgi:hypothetical protein